MKINARMLLAGLAILVGVGAGSPQAAGNDASSPLDPKINKTANAGTSDDKSAIDAIDALAEGLSDCAAKYGSVSVAGTISSAKAIVDIARSCSSSVKTHAAGLLGKSIHNNLGHDRTATLHHLVPKEMVRLCGNDEDCAIKAIQSLGRGIDSNVDPTYQIADAIVKVVRQAPYQRVKDEAIKQLRCGIEPQFNQPTQYIAKSIAKIVQHGPDAEASQTVLAGGEDMPEKQIAFYSLILAGAKRIHECAAGFKDKKDIQPKTINLCTHPLYEWMDKTALEGFRNAEEQPEVYGYPSDYQDIIEAIRGVSDDRCTYNYEKDEYGHRIVMEGPYGGLAGWMFPPAWVTISFHRETRYLGTEHFEFKNAYCVMAAAEAIIREVPENIQPQLKAELPPSIAKKVVAEARKKIEATKEKVYSVKSGLGRKKALLFPGLFSTPLVPIVQIVS